MRAASYIALVVWTAQERDRLQREIDPKRERFVIISANQIVAGMRFNLILVTDSFRYTCYHSSGARRDTLARWLDDHVSARLTKEGRLVNL